jgi:hypothetical protein
MVTAYILPACHLGPAPDHRARVVRSLRPVPAQIIEPMAQIDIVTSKTSFGNHRSNSGGQLSGTFSSAVSNHTRKPWRQRQSSQLAAFLGDSAGLIDCVQFAQESYGFCKRGPRRRIKE